MALFVILLILLGILVLIFIGILATIIYLLRSRKSEEKKRINGEIDARLKEIEEEKRRLEERIQQLERKKKDLLKEV